MKSSLLGHFKQNEGTKSLEFQRVDLKETRGHSLIFLDVATLPFDPFTFKPSLFSHVPIVKKFPSPPKKSSLTIANSLQCWQMNTTIELRWACRPSTNRFPGTMGIRVDTMATNNCAQKISHGVFIWTFLFLLVVSTHLKNISQNWNFPQTGVKIKNI